MSQLQLRIFDGTRQLFPLPASFLVTITDGEQTQHFRDFIEVNDCVFDLPFFDNAFDNYSIVVFLDRHKQAGFVPVKLSDDNPVTLDIMLISDDSGFNFADASWEAAKAKYPMLGSDVDDATGATRYGALEESQKPLACFFNIAEAMSQISFPDGTGPLDYIKQLRWDGLYVPAQDRFFAWCDRRLIGAVKAAADVKQFAVELNPGLLHPGATSSWKQIEFGEANVQLTFHEGESKAIDGIECTTVEPDIDYYKDLGAHILLEVIPNKVTNTLTEPAEVYVLRWIAARAAGAPEFAPLYTITS
ncbi:hypothetical protein [Acidicapsa acidisoli]|uniref:hypothetical protein n=1 Tax=Acidicapsa acidisoli TaxID=1615681 RepID=UPI0021E0E0A4|nr:hypothetical protein [Acidicapsa acidisoli]